MNSSFRSWRSFSVFLGLRYLLAAPIVFAQTSTVPYPRYLKVWNDSFTHEEALGRLERLRLSPEYLGWYRKMAASRPALHRSSIEFLDRDQFFLKSESGQLNLVNTSRMAEGQLLILRKPFNFSKEESLGSIGNRLAKIGGRRTPATYWAPVLAIIDAERRSQMTARRLSPEGRGTTSRRPIMTKPVQGADGLQ